MEAKFIELRRRNGTVCVNINQINYIQDFGVAVVIYFNGALPFPDPRIPENPPSSIRVEISYRALIAKLKEMSMPGNAAMPVVSVIAKQKAKGKSVKSTK